MFLRPTQLTVDLDAVVHNAAIARAHAQGALLCAVVKADAYGHGAVAISQALQAAGVPWFATALVEEALALRACGVTRPILVLAGTFRGAYQAVVEARLTPVVSHIEDLAGLDQAARRAGIVLDMHIEVDTGMARLGVPAQTLAVFAGRVKDHAHLKLAGLMSHLAHADNPAASENAAQMRAMSAAEAAIRTAGLTPHMQHMLNSGGLLCDLGPAKSMVRCGLVLYGLQPQTAQHYVGLRPVMRWTTRPVALRDIAAGTPVSYNGRFVAQRPTRLLTLPVGYADGYKRLYTNTASVLVRGQRAPVVGAVCMDLCMVDVTDIDGVCMDDEVVLMGGQAGAHIGADEMGRWAHSFNYEILCSVGARVPRRYIGGPAEVAR